MTTTTRRHKIVAKGFKFAGTCVRCESETSMRDKRDGYLLVDADGEFSVLCRSCNAYVARVGTTETYAIDDEGDFCRDGQRADW